jgi:hypothetical protein
VSASGFIQPGGIVGWDDPVMWGPKGTAWRWWAECVRCDAVAGAPCTETARAVKLVPPHDERERLPQLGRPPIDRRNYGVSRVRAAMNRPDGHGW